MSNNPNYLDISPLTQQRRELLINALGGFAVTIKNGKLSNDARASFDKIGLSQIEITAIEESNPNDGDYLIQTVDQKGAQQAAADEMSAMQRLTKARK